MRVGVIGAGWAGMAAAVQLQQQGHQVTVLEAARTLGGRARALTVDGPDGTPWTLDNGQHILIGAYRQTLALMHTVGVKADQALLRLPLALVYADGGGLKLPDLPPPWDALVGVVRAKGWSPAEKCSLLLTCARWQLQGFRCASHLTVGQLCKSIPPRLLQEFIDPLCVSALNTPAHASSAQVFLTVLRDSLFSGRGGSNLLIPRTDLGSLLPDAAARWLLQQGAEVVMGERVHHLDRADQGGWLVGQRHFDAVVLATHSAEAARLAHDLAERTSLPDERTVLSRWADTAQALQHTAIGTVYAYTRTTATGGHTLPQPMVALRPGLHQPAQFVFDRGQLAGPQGLLAFVVSASEADRAVLEEQVIQQALDQLGLTHLTPLKTVVEKRATFACTPGLNRPQNVLVPGLYAAGDYTEGPYPATLEGAVMSGQKAAALLCQ